MAENVDIGEACLHVDSVAEGVFGGRHARVVGG